MEDGIDMSSVIANRGLNFAYPFGGAGYGHGYGRGNFAEDGSVVNARTEANGDLLRQIMTDNKMDRLSDKVGENGKAILESELRSADRLSNQTQELLKATYDGRLETAGNSAKLDVIKQQLDDIPYHRHRRHRGRGRG